MKKNRIITIIFLFVLSCVMPKNAMSQIVEVGATLGSSNYIGDINPSNPFLQSKLSCGAAVRYYDSKRWAFRLQYSLFDLASSDKVAQYIPNRMMEFRSKVNDIALFAEFNFLDYKTGSKSDFISPYIFAGISFMCYNTMSGTEMSAVKEPLSGINFSIPFGFGCKYSVNERIGATLEWRMHKSFTDKIDNVTNNVINDKLMPLGYNCDWYSTIALTLSYRFNLPDRGVCHSGIRNVRK